MTNLAMKIHCWWAGHDWEHDSQYPTHSYGDLPHKDSYCTNCGITGAKFLGIKDEETV